MGEASRLRATQHSAPTSLARAVLYSPCASSAFTQNWRSLEEEEEEEEGEEEEEEQEEEIISDPASLADYTLSSSYELAALTILIAP